MAEFLHEVVAMREHEQRYRRQQPVFTPQYVQLYEDVYVRQFLRSAVANNEFAMNNVMRWSDEPSSILMRSIFSEIGCEHRWVFEVGQSSSRTFIYRCMNCDSRHLQQTRGEIHG